MKLKMPAVNMVFVAFLHLFKGAVIDFNLILYANISSRSASCPICLCTEKTNLVLVHSPDSVNRKTKEMAWTEKHNTIRADQQQEVVFRPITGQGEGEVGQGGVDTLPWQCAFMNLGARASDGVLKGGVYLFGCLVHSTGCFSRIDDSPL